MQFNSICSKCGREYGLFEMLGWCPHCKAYYCWACSKNKPICPRCKSYILHWTLVKIGIMLFTFLGVYFFLSFSFMNPIFGTPLALDKFFLLPVILLIALILVVLLLGSRRQQLNFQALTRNQVVIRNNNVARGSVSTGPKWWNNDRYKIYQKIFCYGWILTPMFVVLSIYLLSVSLTDMPIILNVFTSVIWFAVPIWFTYALFIIPIEVGLSNEGIHYRYRTEKPPAGIVQFMKWSEIGSIKVPTSDVLRFIIDAQTHDIEVHDNLHDLVFRTYKAYRKRNKISHEEPILEPELKVIKSMAELKGQVHWEKNRLYWSFLFLDFVVIVVIIGFFLYSIYYIITPISFHFMALGFILIAFMLPLLVLVNLTIPIEVGFSNQGFHLKYVGGVRVPAQREFFAYANLKIVKPTISRFLEITTKSGEDITQRNIDPLLLTKFAEQVDIQRGIMPINSTAIQIEWILNKTRNTLKMRYHLLMIYFIVSPLILVVFYFNQNIVLAIITALVCFSDVILLSNLFSIKDLVEYSPEMIGFSSEGLHLTFSLKKNPPGTKDFFRWKEIRIIHNIREVLPLFTFHYISEENQYCVIENSSGTQYLLGAVDIEELNHIRNRHQNNKNLIKTDRDI
jgi:hypothetical protein